jgi:hypothetical protein
LIYFPELEVKETTDTASSASFLDLYLEFDDSGESFYSPGPVACFSDEDDVSGNQNNCYWPLHSESIARCKHHTGILLHMFGKFMIEARAFNFTYRYINDVLSINNSRFAEFLPLIYPPDLEIKETTDTASSASFFYIRVSDKK